ncbi:Pleckstrin domain-containing family G member [Fasciola hepatica]|uniref:Pleckstrin domain-containing family G member n=1 Tax=Fasciola hepatica TaxID=6192 RepID=A0A4E0RJA9_FASHE|nr:Pleckstrin domain-containing family G member [Fasciola hepatica]
MHRSESGSTRSTVTSSAIRSSKSAQKWNILKHGVIWAQKLRTSVRKLDPMDTSNAHDSTRSSSGNPLLRESVKKQNVDRKEVDNLGSRSWRITQSTGKPSAATTISTSLTATTDPTVKPSIEQAVESTDIPKRAIAKSPSFGQHVRPHASSSSRSRTFSLLNPKRSYTTPVSPTEKSAVSQKLTEQALGETAFEGPAWTSRYDPLPSPNMERGNADLFRLSVCAPPDDEESDEIMPRNESSQSLESESGMDNDSTGTSREISDAVGTSSRPLEYSVRDPEQVEAILRRGRRRAIIDEKNLIGDSESESQDGTSTGAPVAKGVDSISADASSMVGRVNVFRERQQRMLRKQHTIADLNTRIQTTISPQEFDSKRRQNVFMKLIERRSRSKESLLELSEALQRLTPSLFQDHYLESYRESHWSQLENTEASSASNLENAYPDREIRRREAVWELFKSELIFFLDHLMVLKNCFMEPLKKLQVDGYLMFIEPSNLFGNLDDLCYVSHTLCRELISNLTRDAKNKEFGSTDVLLRPLKRWSEHSKDGEVYHSYCLNYDSALSYLDSLRKVDHFNEFEKWCEQDPRCRRLQLTDLLVAPMQHYMKIPLLLASIRRYTADVSEREILTSCVNKVENSLKSLEDKMRWLKNFERLQEIQSQLIWPSISEMEPRVFIPEFLRQSMSRQPCERLIANPKRQLLHEGFLTFSDGSKIVEIFAFLFDDFLLITRIKKQPKKKSFSENTLNSRSLTEGGIFIVYRQAIALDRFTIHDLGLAEANANGLRHAFVLVLITRFQQITGVYTLQATNELDKIRWIEKLRQSQQLFQEKLKQKLYGIDSDHQTNKHSKVVLNKHKTHFGLTMDEEPTIGRELYTSIPSRASSASPSSMHRMKAASSEIPEVAEEEQTTRPASIALPAVHIEAFQHRESKCNKCPENAFSIYDEPQKSSTCLSPKVVDETHIGGIGKGSQSKPLVYFTEPMDKSRPVSDNSLLNATEIAKTKQRLFEDHFVDIAASLKKEHPTSTDTPVQSTSAPMLMKHLPETKVEFFYSPTGQSPFSPPLSPILHPPCASLPSAVTLPDSYEYSSSRFHDELEHRMNRLRIDQEKSKPTDHPTQPFSSNKPT